MKPEIYIHNHYCPVCQKETPCEYYSAGHERDSTGDKITCTICKSVNYGMGDEWDTPDGKTVIEE